MGLKYGDWCAIEAVMRIKKILFATRARAALAIAAAFPGTRRWNRIPTLFEDLRPTRGETGNVEDRNLAETPDISELLRGTLQRDIGLAADHVHSIWWLLEIARQHNQPIPAAALTNLDLVSKHLREMLRLIEETGKEVALESGFQRTRTDWRVHG